jgi:hypothetical protein
MAECGCCAHDCLSAKLPHTPPSPFSWGGRSFVIMKILFLVIVRARSVKRVFQNLKNCKITNTQWRRSDISAFRVCRQYVRDCRIKGAQA